MSDSPPTVVGRYAIFGELAHGGMATLHIGKLLGAVGFSRTVAIKRLHPQFAHDPQFAMMFLDEARLAARIHHPNVVPVLDVIYRDQELFLVMEYVEGETLFELGKTLKARRQRVPVRILSTIMSGVLHGLHAAHEGTGSDGQPLKIVHRDVSPQNIIVGTDGIARVLDFGIAKATKRLQHTELGKFKGKISYMAPEQLMGEEVDRRADVYAASVVFWEMLVGQKLYPAEEPGAVALAIVDGHVPKPSEKAVGVSKVLDEVVLKGLAQDPGERFHTAREMALAIEKAVPPAPNSQVGDWVRTIASQVLEGRAKIVASVEKTRIDNHALGVVGKSNSDGTESTVTFRLPALSSPPPGEAQLRELSGETALPPEGAEDDDPHGEVDEPLDPGETPAVDTANSLTITSEPESDDDLLALPVRRPFSAARVVVPLVVVGTLTAVVTWWLVHPRNPGLAAATSDAASSYRVGGAPSGSHIRDVSDVGAADGSRGDSMVPDASPDAPDGSDAGSDAKDAASPDATAIRRVPAHAAKHKWPSGGKTGSHTKPKPHKGGSGEPDFSQLLRK